ncbi:cupin-like domain-containing protein [Dyella kyungheensis]|uniref:Cupin-like domain-containing protein n=1 Tax=Dyella kyungheensis TaxID=1242174 RepID=A0ABS2JRP3_9GAMM|nr:cupin-like domain-containing protein [Dyella kyungheensis]MBM7121092.1 cupin-like domain-containing protein [Dyella kyungheensis]
MPAPMEAFRYEGQADALDSIVGGDRPVVIRGLVKHWPLVKAAGESDQAFAAQLIAADNGTPVDALLMPPEAEGIVGYRGDAEAFNFTHHRASVTQALQRLLQFADAADAPGIALQSAPIASCLPRLLDHHRLPLLDPAVTPRLWIGNRVTTPAHFDEYRNIACVVCGVRRFTLFPPEQVRNLYIGPLDFAPTGAAISMARLDRLDDPRYPRLREAMRHALVAELEPGDAIYIPPMWWHHVASLGKLNALVNYWWMPAHGSGLAPNTRLGGLLHCILLFKSLPPAERAAWRELLDHYVFGDEDPAAHIPAHRRGWLGELDEEQSRKLLERIRQYL